MLIVASLVWNVRFVSRVPHGCYHLVIGLTNIGLLTTSAHHSGLFGRVQPIKCNSGIEQTFAFRM